MDIFVRNKYLLRKIGIFIGNQKPKREQLIIIKWLHISEKMFLLVFPFCFVIAYIYTIDKDNHDDIRDSICKSIGYIISIGTYAFIIAKESELKEILRKLQWMVNRRELIA